MKVRDANTGTKMAAGTVDIMPEAPLPLGGYDNRTESFRSVDEPLEANVLIANDGRNEYVLATLDLLYPGEVLRNRILEKANLAHRPEAFFLAASHTHFAPMTQYGTPRLGIPADAYVEFVASRVAALMEKLRHRLAETSLMYCEGAADHSVNRRLKRMRLSRSGLRHAAELGPNNKGPRDERIRLLRLADPSSGKVTAIVWNYACHPTGFPDRLTLSAEFPGAVRRNLRQHFGGIPVLFLQGFSGDLRPPFRGKLGSPRSLALRVLMGPQFGAPDMDTWKAWSESLGARVLHAAQSPGKLPSARDLSGARHSIPICQVADGDSQGKSISVHVMQIGDTRFVGLGAEPANAYRSIVERKIGADTLFTAGCIDQTHSYLPTDSMLSEGGYEVEGFRSAFNFEARFKSGLEEAVSSALDHIAPGGPAPKFGVPNGTSNFRPPVSAARHRTQPADLSFSTCSFRSTKKLDP